MQNRLNKESTDRNGYRGTAQCTHTYSDIHLIYLRSYKTEREYAVSWRVREIADISIVLNSAVPNLSEPVAVAPTQPYSGTSN